MTQGEGLLGASVFFVVFCFVINFALIYRGLTKGIERFCLVAMPALIVCVLVVLVRSLTLGTPDPAKPDQDVLNGLGFMWNPSTPRIGFFESLASPQMWMDAAGQIFFSLSVGFGIVITYASYLRKDDDVALSSLTSVAGNEFCEVALGGMIAVPAAFVFFGAGIMDKLNSTFELGFVTLPNVFGQMLGGRMVDFLFFFLLLSLAAITSSLLMLQPAIALLEEGLGLGRKASVALLGVITVVGSALVVLFSHRLAALDTLDFWIGAFAIYVLATFQVSVGSWGGSRLRGTPTRGRDPHPVGVQVHHQVRLSALPAQRFRCLVLLPVLPATQARRADAFSADRYGSCRAALRRLDRTHGDPVCTLDRPVGEAVACGGTEATGGRPMTAGGWGVMLLSVGGVTTPLAWGIYKVITPPGSTGQLHSQADIETPDVEEE